MRRSTTRNVARTLALGWVLAGGFADPLSAGTPGSGTVATAAIAASANVDLAAGATSTATGSCAESISCGSGCTATLATGFCLSALSWEGGLKIGGATFGPSASFECTVCDCWYLQPGENGTLLYRQSTFACTATINGLTLQ